MQSFEQIRAQVGRWSQENFSGQETPYLRVYHAGSIKQDHPRSVEDAPGDELTCPLVIGLDGLAPLMGMVEEVGELFDADSKDNARDAIGDIAVYLCDYCYREGVGWPRTDTIPDREKLKPVRGVVVDVGKLFHCHLKRFQRIRGFHNLLTFSAARMEAIYGLVWHLEQLAKEETSGDLLMLLNETWNSIIRKRDWRTDPVGGGGHTHQE